MATTRAGWAAAALALAAAGTPGPGRPGPRERLSWPPPAPALPAPAGSVVRVSSVAGLEAAVSRVASGTTILVAKGAYRLEHTLVLGPEGRGSAPLENVAIRGETGRPEDVVITGKGMENADFGGVPHGILVRNARGVLVADLSIGEVYHHPIQLSGPDGASRVTIRNCRLFDAGEQFVKASVGEGGPGSDGGVVEHCVIEYTRVGPEKNGGYTNGVDVHRGAGWVVRKNLFRRIHVKPGLQYQAPPSVLFWNGSRDTLCEKNVFLDCDRAIAFGLVEREGFHDHEGGIIRNNAVWTGTAIRNADAGIVVCDSPGTKVLHNTVLVNGTYQNSIEYRFRGSAGVVVANNLVDAAVAARDGGAGTAKRNYDRAMPGFFANPSGGDLHLLPHAFGSVPRGASVSDCEDDLDGEPRPKNQLQPPGADLPSPQAP